MKQYMVLAQERGHSLSIFKIGPFRDRAQAERMAVELAKRSDVCPPITIRTEDVEDDVEADDEER